MGNAKQRSLTSFQYNITLSSIVKALYFQSKMERDTFIQLANRRMSIRSSNVPRIIYYHNVESSHSLKLYFENYGRPIQQFSQHSIEPFCKCMELLTTIEQLRERYGIFGFSLSQVFLKVQDTHKSIFAWICGDVQKCQPVKIGSEQKMCGNVLTTLKNICSRGDVDWREDNGGNFQHLSDLIQWARQRHTQEYNSNVIWQDDSISKAQTKSICAESYYVNDVENGQFNYPSQDHNNIKINMPKLDCRSIKSYSNRSGARTERVLVNNNQEKEDSFEQYKDSLVVLTTARTPRANYLMRKSNDLTIFPNQYQQKFINKYRQKCKQQQSKRFQTFKKAMLRCKTKTEPQQSFSFIFKGKAPQQ